jgi:hypothetical protein
MATDPEMPRTQTSAPTKPASTTEDVPAERRNAGSEREPSREAGERGDRMPKGADEPGAGL